MDTNKRLIVSCILIMMSSIGVAQNSGVSTWVVDKQTSFTCQDITYSENSDTVIFRHLVTFRSSFVQIDSAEEIIFNRQTKKLVMESNSGSMRLNEGMKFIIAVPFSVGNDAWKGANYNVDHFIYPKRDFVNSNKDLICMNKRKYGIKIISDVPVYHEDDLKKIKTIEYTIGDNFVLEK